MRARNRMILWALGLAGLGAVVTSPASGGGFGIFEQGTKAMGMAGAYTAQADDPSAMFHNVAGIAFVEEQEFLAGLTFISSFSSEFKGANPFPGDGITEELEMLAETPIHFYWVRPINDTWSFGLGLNTPFGLKTEWKDPSNFSGRFISTFAELRTFDLTPTVAVKLSDDFSLGASLVLRTSDVQLTQHIPQANPFTQSISDVATLVLESDFDSGVGFNFGVLHKYNNSFSWGLSYRGGIDVDYGGDGRLTQNLTGIAPFDGAIAAALPFGRNIPVATGIDFPEMASLGFAFALSPNVVLETDFNWTGWSSFEELVVDFTNDDLPDAVRPQGFDDVYNYRLGIKIDKANGNQLRFGYVFDESPQPEEGVSPLLPDADRNGFTVGYGFQGNKVNWDVALMYLDFKDRTRSRSFPGEGDFFGTYQNQGLLIGFTAGF